MRSAQLSINEGCKKAIDPKSDRPCQFYTNYKQVAESNYFQKKLKLPRAWDIEDLVLTGQRKSICPYYSALNLQRYADLIVCPYNYIIDEMIKKAVIFLIGKLLCFIRKYL